MVTIMTFIDDVSKLLFGFSNMMILKQFKI